MKKYFINYLNELKTFIAFSCVFLLNFFCFGQNIVGSTASGIPIENTPFIISGGIGIQTYDSYEPDGVAVEDENPFEEAYPIMAYPNPSSEYIVFSTSQNDTPLAEYNAQIFNFSGRLIRDIEKISDMDQVNVSLLPNGIYLLWLTETNTGKKTVFKFIKRNK